MTKPKVWITRQIDPTVVEKLQQQADVEIWPGENPPSKVDFIERMPHISGLISMLTDPIDQAVIEAAGPGFKVISQMAVGFDNIDVAAATRRDIPIGHTPGVLTETTADLAWALLMAAARRVVEAHNEVQQGIWRPWGPDVLTGFDVYGATLGIIGFGRIGQALARRARGFNMRILYYNTTRRPELEDELGVIPVSLDDLLKQSDFVSLHTYLSPATHHLMNRSQFEKMKPNAILVNTARGAIVDPEALLWAVEQGRIAGAALDVFDPEPVPTNHPLLEFQNVIITPHIGSASKATRVRMAHITVDNLLAGLAGKRLLYCANPQVYG